MMFCLILWNTPHIIKLIAYLVLRYFWVILPLSLDVQGIMAIDIGFWNFSYFVREGDSKGFLRAPSVRTPYPTPTPSKYISSIKNPIPSGQPPCQPLPAGCYSEPGQGRQATYHIHASTRKHTRKRKRISSSYNIMLAKPAWTLGL